MTALGVAFLVIMVSFLSVGVCHYFIFLRERGLGRDPERVQDGEIPILASSESAAAGVLGLVLHSHHSDSYDSQTAAAGDVPSAGSQIVGNVFFALLIT